uniref:NADH dehydrogenase subunit 6 n=1 Tax=Xyloredo nooi TaxID=2584333 RepID=UPI002027BBF5|nr:NADH dehydrogenase subunit 6 [Xyloredo nooi]UPX88991.1 NADH dehydrogenase subunit 6 [Xyloredo nooi]UPX89003.1 NADH dehydrogenase subunit 6 [Xyloredo nooi]
MGFLLLVLFMLWNLLFFLSSPLGLIVMLLSMSVFSVFLVSLGFSFVVGFCLFMCMVSGVLVLVSYCVALIPFTGSSLGINLIFKHMKGWGEWLFAFLFSFFVFLSCFKSEEGFSGFSFVRSVEGFLCTEEWLVIMVLLSLYLFLAIVVCVNICSKYSGALIGENWFLQG